MPDSKILKFSEKPTHGGHRARLCKRFFTEGLEGFADHEVLEILLFSSIPRGDTNAIGHALLSRFGSISGVFTASMGELLKVDGIGPASANLIKLIAPIALRYTSELKTPVRFSNTLAAAEYICAVMFGKPQEEFRIFLLDINYRLISHRAISLGTVERVHIHLRNIAGAVIGAGAARVIVAHNHPGGSVSPSKNDIEITKRLFDMLKSIESPLVDHIITSGNEYYSFSAMKKMTVCETQPQSQAAQYCNQELTQSDIDNM